MMKNNDVIMKGMQLANELKMKCLVTCATNGIYMDKLLENVVRSHSVKSRVTYI